MKILILLVTVGHLLQEVCLQQQHSGANVISVRLLSGSLREEADAYANSWVLNTKIPPLLPITKSKLAFVHDYLEYSSPAANNQTKKPKFGFTLDVPSSRFTDQSILALEIYNNATTPPSYIAGRIEGVSHVKALPHSYKLKLYDQYCNDAGSVDIEWN